jgi:EmrB/QacA subfamily drug resistance transporter
MADPQTSPAPALGAPDGGPSPGRPGRGGARGAAAPSPGRSDWDRRKWYILAAICVAQFMVVLDVAVVNVALPSIRSDLHFSVESLQWVLSAYAIFFGGFLLLGGRLADVLGRRRLFMIGLILFAGASLACGLSWSEASLITFRCIQGLGGALLSPAALSILVATFAEGRERNLALGIWGGIAGSGAAAGTLLGGVLTSGLGWQWIFYVNVPIGIALIALCPFLLPASRLEGAQRAFDLPGAVTVTGGLMVLVYALTRATQVGWSAAETIGLLVAAAVLLSAFVVIEVRSRNAVLPLRILGLRTPRAANVVGFLIGAGLFSQFFLLSLYMQQVLGYSALKTGVAYIATTFLVVVSAVLAQSLVNRFGSRVVLPVGLALAAVAVVLYTRLPAHGSYVADLLPGFLLTGFGLGLAFVPDTISSLTGARGDEAGAASGLINTSQQIGGAVGLAVITTVATTATTSYLRTHAGLGALAPVAAATHGFQVGFWVLAGVLAGAAVLAAVLIESKATMAAEAAAAVPAAAAGPVPARAAVAVPARPRPVQVLGLVAASAPGAGRRSYQRSLFRAAQRQAPEGMTIDEFDVAALPDYPGDGVDRETAEPVQVERLRAALRRAGGVLVATPQYDGDVRTALRNALAWASDSPDGREALAGKPLAVMGASCDEGHLREAQRQLSDVMGPARYDGAGGARLLWSCVRDGGRTEALRESVGGLLTTLADAARSQARAA